MTLDELKSKLSRHIAREIYYRNPTALENADINLRVDNLIDVARNIITYQNSDHHIASEAEIVELVDKKSHATLDRADSVVGAPNNIIAPLLLGLRREIDALSLPERASADLKVALDKVEATPQPRSPLDSVKGVRGLPQGEAQIG